MRRQAKIRNSLAGAMVFILLTGAVSGSMGQSSINSSLVFNSISTGRTSGHIANLTIKNPTDQREKVDIGGCYIPSSGQYQPYIVPKLASISIPPHGELTIPVKGYCVDIFLPPVPQGEPLIPIDKWVMPGPLAVNWQPEVSKGWVISEQSNATIPGQQKPLGHVININEHPKEAAPVLLEAINRITESYDELQGDGNVTTPFSGNIEKERESVIQQTFWIYSSELTGRPYKVTDFAKNTAEQYEAATGKKLKDMPEPEQEEMVDGIADFWVTFQAVGAEAKVLKSDERPADDIQFGIWTDIKDFLFAPDYSKVKKADDFDKIRRTKYDKYVVEREINKKSHEDACEAIDIDSESDFADACKRVYGK
jgi:hypothetical protein